MNPKKTFLFVVAYVEPCGGNKVIWRFADGLRRDGWRTAALAVRDPWAMQRGGWEGFDLLQAGEAQGPFAAVCAAHNWTIEAAMAIPAGRHFGLMQADDPAWCVKGKTDEGIRRLWATRGLEVVGVSPVMLEFRKKYGLNMIGFAETGVDSTVFTPGPEARRPGTLMLVGKGDDCWFAGTDAVRRACELLRDEFFEVNVLSVGRPTRAWPVPWRHVVANSEAEMRTLYRRADIFLSCSLLESNPLSVLEAMACGVPVVSTPAGLYYCEDGREALFFQPEDAAGLARAIRRVWTEPKLRERLTANALATAHQRTWERGAEQFCALVGRS